MKKNYEDPEVMIIDISDEVTLGDDNVGSNPSNNSGSL